GPAPTCSWAWTARCATTPRSGSTTTCCRWPPPYSPGSCSGGSGDAGRAGRRSPTRDRGGFLRPGGPGAGGGCHGVYTGMIPIPPACRPLAQIPLKEALMARGINKAILVGNLGNDPETKYTQGGMAITKISPATTSVRKDKDGNTQETTQWHRVTFF